MDINEIKELLELIEASAIEEFEMEKSGVKIRIRKSLNSLPTSTVSAADVSNALPVGVQIPVSSESETREEEEEEEFYVFKAPIVGTCYLAPKPDAEPFVRVGDKVNQSTVLCIIEAMKIFNQIESDVAGEIVDILVENGQPVEFGEPLFKIR